MIDLPQNIQFLWKYVQQRSLCGEGGAAVAVRSSTFFSVMREVKIEKLRLSLSISAMPRILLRSEKMKMKS